MGIVKDAVAEIERKAKILGKINTLQSKINDARKAMNDLGNDKTKLDGYITTFEGHQKTLSGKYLEIKQNDVFEGNMATILKNKIDPVEKAISDGIKYSNDLSQQLDTQIKNLNNKITSWETEKNSLKRSL